MKLPLEILKPAAVVNPVPMLGKHICVDKQNCKLRSDKIMTKSEYKK